MAEKELILKISFDTIKELEGQLKKVTAEFKQAAIGSDEFNKKANEIKTLNNELKAVQATTKEVTKETNNLQKAYDIAFGNVEASLGDMQRALRLLKNEGFEGKTKEEIAKLNSAVGTLKNNIQDSVALNKALDKGEVFNNMRAGLQGAVAAAQLLGSALKLMGVESESAKKLEAATLQLMSATQALQVIRDLHDKGTIKALAIQTKEMVMTAAHTAQTWASTTATIARTKAEEAQAVMTGKAGLASKAAAAMQWLWNAAIAASPIGWIALAVAGLAVGIGALVVQMNKQTEAEKKNAMVKQANLDIQNEVNAKTGEAIGKIKALQSVVNDTTISEKNRIDALKQLKEETGGAVTITDLSTESLKTLNSEIGVHIQMLQKQAEGEAWIQKYQEGYKKLIDYQTDLTKNASNGFIDFVMKTGDFVMGMDNNTKLRQKNQKENIKEQEKLNEIYLEGIKKTVDFVGKKENESRDITVGNLKKIYDERTKWANLTEKERDDEMKLVLKRADELMKLEEKKMLDAKKRLDDTYKMEQEQNKKLIELDREREEKKVQDENDAFSRKEKYNEENLEIERQYNQAVIDITGTAFDTMFNIKSANDAAYYDQKLQKITDDSEFEKTKLKEQLDNKLISQAQYDQNLSALEAKKKAQESKMKMEQFKKQQNAAVTQALISGALAVIAAASTQPYIPLGIIAQALAVATTIASVATIKSQPVPQFGGGGSFKTTKPTMIMVGDNPGGVEHVSVTPISGIGQTKVNPSSGLIQMAGGGSIISDGGLSRSNNSNTTISTFLKAIKEMPAPILDLQEFTIKQEKTTRIKERANL